MQSGGWVESVFDVQQVGAPVTVDVLVRHENDPYLAFVDISDGSLDFGLSTAEKVLLYLPLATTTSM